jgi:glucosylceramidase
MPTKTTRRKFLTSSALGLMATTAAGSLPGYASNAQANQDTPANSSASASGEINVWVTNDTKRYTRQVPIRWQPASGVASNTIVLNQDKKFQQILGFGGAFTDAACYMFNQLAAPQRDQLLHELFHPSEMGFNVCRTCIGASDYSTKAYTYDEGDPDPELKRFSIEHDREYILPVLRDARKANPDLFLFSTPWTPPGWMKSGGSMLGGSMRRRYLKPYAQYFIKFLQSYAAEGVTVQAVTVQNEVDTDQDARMPACIFPQEYEIEFVRDLGPLLEQSGLKTKIWILDHNYNLWGRAICELEDPAVRKYSNAVAWHGYYGTPDMASRVHEEFPDAEMYWTEGGPDYTSPDYLTDWAKWGKTFTLAFQNWCRSITAWNLALDERGRPNIGPFPCGGIVTIDSKSKEITRSGQYWAFAHFSRKIRRGAQRFESQSTLPGVSHAAFKNPDGTQVLVVSNPEAEQKISIQLGASTAEATLDTNSLTTFVWS